MAKLTEFVHDNEKFPVYIHNPASTPTGGLIVIHEIWGLNDHTKAVADRFADKGYLVVAPDLLTITDIARHADTLALDLFNPEKRNEAQPKLRELMTPMQAPDFAKKTLDKVKICFDYLYDTPAVKQRVAITGFCFGGSYSFNLAIHEPRLKAAIPFYGHSPMDINELAKIKCPVLAFYGEEDQGLMGDLPQLKHLMKKASVNFSAVVFPEAGHAFFNDTNSFAYNQAAAKDSWQQTLDFLSQYIDK